MQTFLILYFLFLFRYNCNRYNEDDAKAARDAQEVVVMFLASYTLAFQLATIQCACPLLNHHIFTLTRLRDHVHSTPNGILARLLPPPPPSPLSPLVL